MKNRIFFDMDNVLVSFQSGLDKVHENIKKQYRGKKTDGSDRMDEIFGIFSLMEPLSGTKGAVRKLAEIYDVYILSTAPWENPLALTEKVLWIKNHIGNLFKKKVILTHHKVFIRVDKDDILIDESPNNGACDFQGEWIQSGSKDYPDWNAVLAYLLPHK